MKAIYILILCLISLSSQRNGECKREIISFFKRKTNGNKIATAGMMGNLYDESRYRSIDLEDASESEDRRFTNKINKNGGNLDVLLSTSKGYGLVQWTHHSRKEAFFNHAKKYFRKKGRKFDIGDCDMQLDFLWTELTSSDYYNYKGWLRAKTVEEATEIIMMGYEEPDDKSPEHLNLRIRYAWNAYNELW